MNFTIDVDARELTAALKAAPMKVTYHMNIWVSKTTLMTEREAKIEASKKTDTGQTQNSIHSRIGSLKGEVNPTAKHAKFAHDGRRPGRMPPFGEGTSLASWARRHGIPAFAVARSIARKGTKGHPFMTNAFRTIKPRAERDAHNTLDKIVRSI